MKRPSYFSRCTQSSRQGFTLAEILVAVVIIAVLLGLLMPALSKMRESGNTAKCMNNQRQILVALGLYANDNRGELPLYAGYVEEGSSNYDGGQFWNYRLAKYLTEEKPNVYPSVGETFLRCPSAPAEIGLTYGVNYPLVFGVKHNPYFPSSMKMMNIPATTILTADADAMGCFFNPYIFPLNTQQGDYGVNDSFGSYKFNFARPRHNDKLVCGFADGSVKAVVMIDFLTNRNGMWGPVSQ